MRRMGIWPVLALVVACQGDDALRPNREPETSLANVPVANTVATPYLAVLTLSWDGGDPDGYIVGYEFSWTTHHLVEGDSIVIPWQFTARAETTFAFESSDSVNLQVFKVRAKDNDGAYDPTPASIELYTAQVQAPESRIIEPDSGAVFYMLPSPTDTWDGITFTFVADDADGEVTGYSWRVDERDWSAWNPASSVTLYRQDLPALIAGSHTFAVKARDNTMVEDPTPAVVDFTVVEPAFDRSLLIVDETRDGAGGPETPTDIEVDDFYQTLIGTRSFDAWDYAQSGTPPKDVMGRYRVVLWHSDDMTAEVGGSLADISSYLDIGGKLVLGGWKILTTIAGGSGQATFTEGFPLDYLHLGSMNHVSGTLWRGGIGTGEWEWATVRPDTVKLRSNRRGNLPEVDTIQPSTVFCAPVLLFDHLREDSTVHLQPCATFYDGTTYDVAYFGFPLFYTQVDQISPVLDDLLRRMGE